MIRACIVGWPVAHSRSPLIHGHWLSRYGIDGAYGREAVAPADFAGFLRSLDDRGYAGCNVTLPHKEQALSLVDEADATAAALGAANTIWRDGGRLHALNSDVPGYLASLDAEVPGWDREVETALVLGAGGAARGIIFGLLSRGVARIHVANRSADRAEAVAQSFGARVVAADWARLPLDQADLLVNTTSLGMTGHPPLALDLAPLKGSAIVSDIVYVPLETELLKDAQRRCHRTIGGLGMLLHQAVPGFERWFGVRPEVTADLFTLVAGDIARAA